MKNNNTTSKLVRPQIKIGGSLTRRVALICCIFLVVPLLFYSIFIYQQIYREELVNVYDALDRSQKEQKIILSDWINHEMESLDFLYNLILARQESKNFNKEILTDLLKKFSEQEHVLVTIFLGLSGCSSDDCNAITGSNLTIDQALHTVSLDGVKQDNKIQRIQYIPGIGNALVLIRAFPSSSDSNVIDAVIISMFNMDALVHRLKTIQTKYEEDFSILNDDGIVLASTNPDYVSKTIGQGSNATILLHPIPKQRSGYYFSVDDQMRFGDMDEYEPAKLYLFADVPEAVLFDVWHQYLKHFLILLFTILMIGGGATALLARRISMPLRKLIQTMIKVGEGDLQARYIPDKMGFEINELGKQFNLMVDALIENMEKLEAEKIKQETYKQELAIGQNAQRSLLPSSLPKLDQYDVDAGFTAALEVGGDFYDLYMKDDDEVFFCIADTSGKGIYACIYSLVVRSMLRSFFDSGNSLDKIIKKTNELFLKDTGYTGVFVTAWVGILNIKTNRLTYTSCGHLPAIYLNEQNKIERLQTRGVALGVSEFEPEIKETFIQNKSSLILYTDGIIEAHSLTNELFGEKRFEEILLMKDWKTAKELVCEIENQIRSFASGKPQHDDVTLLVIRSLKE